MQSGEKTKKKGGTPRKSHHQKEGGNPTPILKMAHPSPSSSAPRKTAIVADRAKADALIAKTSAKWYAGAAFDRTPDPQTLPKPRNIPADRVGEREPEKYLASSCPASGSLETLSSLQDADADRIYNNRTTITSPELREKSRNLLRLIKGEGSTDMSIPKVNTQPHKEVELNEMTRQMRLLLNMPPSGRPGK